MLHQIGIGTLGPVFRTYEPTRDRLVAVKAFRLDIVPEQAQALAAALTRAVQASLFHPSIVEPIDAGVEGTLAYRAEEYVAAESLDVAMRHYAPASIEKALPFITQLAGAIDFARAAGIGHGGLHPRDIFVTPDEARATGFGVVEALEQVGIRAPIRRPYSAPERIDGSAWGTPADVFSLAAITFELLTGKRPAGTGPRIGTLPEGPHSTALQSVLARAMDDDPARRHGSALAFAGALEAASQGRPITEVREEPDVPGVLGVPDVPAATVPGELEIEARLDPVHEALEDAAIKPAPVEEPEAALLFDDMSDDEMRVRDSDDERFTDDFVEEQAAPALRSPLEAEPPLEPPAPIPVEAPMFRAAEPEPGLDEAADRGRSPVLPYALILVLGLLGGFAGGYFMGSRDRLPAPQDTTAANPSSAATPSAAASVTTPAAATADKPGQYSEQKVTAAAPPAAATATPGPETPRQETAAATRGQIVVRSLPSHAGVTLNGTWRGRTPLTIDNVAFGNYIVRVVQPGYQVARDEFSLSARAPSHTFTTRLQRAWRATPPPVATPPATELFTGSLYVDSRPRGASVFVDGRNVGLTPLSIPDVRAGSHVVRIEMAGKKPVMANPRVVSGKMERITVSLEDR